MAAHTSDVKWRMSQGIKMQKLMDSERRADDWGFVANGFLYCNPQIPQ